MDLVFKPMFLNPGWYPLVLTGPSIQLVHTSPPPHCPAVTWGCCCHPNGDPVPDLGLTMEFGLSSPSVSDPLASVCLPL